MSVSLSNTLQLWNQSYIDIEDSISHLNRKLIKIPKKVELKKIHTQVEVELEKIKRQVDTLIELNQQIATQQKQQSKGCCNRCWSLITTSKGLLLASSVVFFILDSCIKAYYSNIVDNAPVLLTVDLFVGAVALEVTNVGLWWTSEQADTKRDKELKLLINNVTKAINNLKLENLKNFLKSFSDFKKETQNDKTNKSKQKLKNCINCLEKVPSQFKEMLPPTNSWVSLLLQLLEKDHPLKIKFELLYGNVEKINSSSSENVPEKFKSENEPFNLKHRTQTQINSHQQNWQELEQELDLHLSYLEKDGTRFDRSGQTWEPEEKECVIDMSHLKLK